MRDRVRQQCRPFDVITELEYHRRLSLEGNECIGRGINIHAGNTRWL